MLDLIRIYQLSLVFYSGNHVVRAAVSDYAQAASSKYPVYKHPELWSGYAEPITYEFTVPRDWCTEFVS